MAIFNPDKQTEYTADLERCYMGTAPALATVGRAFGDYIAESWLAIQLADLSKLTGKHDKLKMQQFEVAAKVIKAEFGYMSVTQLMHFFQMFKGGKYGKFYGAVDPIVITEALRQYAVERFDMMRKFEQQRKQRQDEEQERAHAAEVQRLNDALSVCNMTPYERHLLRPLGLTLEEIAEIGWLFRLGYEQKKGQAAAS